eukprot:5550099-Pyramimonas_sp.AAC.1
MSTVIFSCRLPSSILVVLSSFLDAPTEPPPKVRIIRRRAGGLVHGDGQAHSLPAAPRGEVVEDI